MTVVSEESGITGPTDGAITVVIDPIDGSSNAARDIPYWATSLCALDREGPLAALVINHATGSSYRAVRGGGATRDGRAAHAVDRDAGGETRSSRSRTSPAACSPWKQFRALGSCALALCDVAAGALDGYFDAGSVHAPWDYLGGYLICTEAGVQASSTPRTGRSGSPTRTRAAGSSPPARRQLLQALRAAAG